MSINIETLPGMVDVTAIMADARISDIEFTCRVAKAYRCRSIIVNPCYLTYALKNTIGHDHILKGTTAGFPLGSELTSVKVYAAKQAEIMGAQELDIVMNVGAFLSGNLKYTRQDIDAVCESVKIPVKVIVEAALLSDTELFAAAALVSKTKAAFVKTNTGLYQKPTTVAQVQIIHDAVEGRIPIKASGGIRSLADLLNMVDAGASVFGIGAKSAHAIFQEIDRTLKRDTPPID